MANKSNTVEKGDAFENRVFSKFSTMLELGELPLNSKRSCIYPKKKYTDINGSDVIFDIAIETYRENAEKPSYITLIECKDYNSPIKVEKIRDFETRIKDIGGHKGYFITTSKFQKSAFNKAKTAGIGLIMMDKFNELTFVLERVGKQSYQIRADIEAYFTDDESKSKYPFVAIDGYNYYTSVYDFLSDIVGHELKLPFEIPFISEDEIEESIISVFGFKNRKDIAYCITTEELVNAVKQQYNVEFIFEQNLEDEIGYCNLKNNTIAISNNLEFDTPRWRFTLAHEIGHYILHKDLFNRYEISIASDDESNFSNTLEDLGNKLTKKIEIQANLFASLLLLPKIALGQKYSNVFYERYGSWRKFPYLYVDKQPWNINDYNYISRRISESFGVSKEVVKYRLIKENILTWNF